MSDRPNSFTTDAGSAAAALGKTFLELQKIRFAEGFWSRQLDLWSADSAVQQKVANRLGWLDAIDFVTPHIPRLQACADAVRRDGFTDVVLLGMGGSSLAPEVLREVVGIAPGFPRFRMLDSVDPDSVRRAFDTPATTLFVLASKSGGTIEPNVMAAEARRRLQDAGLVDWASRFIAITDEGTALHERAQEEKFRDIFVNPSTIGGRYSALSFFGMVPAALMGIDVKSLLRQAGEMAERCHVADPAENPGLALGALMAAGALNGRDKLTVLLPPALAPLGLWIEQLVAESTGKHGKGVVPIAGERASAPHGNDRIGVSVFLNGAGPDDSRARLRAAGTPMMDIEMPSPLAIGAEFFRWEVATAAAGRLLEINPFDEPNVQQAKDATRVLLDAYIANRRLPMPEPHASIDDARMTLSAAAQDELGGQVGGFLGLIKPGDYLGLLAYFPPDDQELAAAFEQVRADLGTTAGCATMFGYGPRYLHSTGQLHKGGANNGVFIVVVAPPVHDLPIPGEPFSFGVLEMAQALGDFQSLERSGRRAMLLQLPSRDPSRLLHAFASLRH